MGSSEQPQRVFQSKAQIKAYYDKIAGVYDLLAEHSEQPMRDKGLAVLAAASGERVLEIGYGTGHCIEALARSVGPTGRVFGIDLSDAMREIAEKRVAKAELTDRVELVCGDAEELPWDNASMDGVFTSFTMELFDTPAIPQVLAQCRRVLKPGGRLVVVALSKEGHPGLATRVYEWTHEHFPNLMDCRPIYARRATEEAGFSVRSVEMERMWVAVEIVLAINP